MCTEDESNIGRKESPLPPGHRLLFPDPGFILGAAFKKTYNDPYHSSTSRENSHELLMKNVNTLLSEYFSILNPIVNIIGTENIALVKNKITVGKTNKQTQEVNWERLEGPTITEIENINLKSLPDHLSVWLRDSFMNFGSFTFINPEYFPDIAESETIVRSLLSEGGAVLPASNVVLVNKNIWQMRHQDRGYQLLESSDFSLAPLPEVDAARQKYEFTSHHNDGHAALIVDKYGRLDLLAAISYTRQGDGTRKKIRGSVGTVGAELYEVDDRNLPPLALNFFQFADKTVLISESENRDLIQLLQDLVGRDKVIITDKPIIEIPKLLFGSIRCMINTFPNNLLSLITD